MVTLMTLAVWEMVIVVLPDAGLPPAAVAGLMALVLMALVAVAAVDLNAGFLTRLAFLIASAWYIGSIGRWMLPLNDLFVAVGDTPGMVLAMSLLIVAPMGLLLVSIAGPTAHAWRRYRNRG